MARKFLTPLELESVSNATGDILTLSGGVVSLRTATQIRSDIGAAATSHNHTIGNVTGLQSALDGKAASSHNHNSDYLKLSGGSLSGDLYVGSSRPNQASTLEQNAPEKVTILGLRRRAVIDSISAFTGEGDYFYCVDRNPDFTVTSTLGTPAQVSNLFDNNMASNMAFPVDGLSENPWILEITKNSGSITATDVLTLMLTGHRLGHSGVSLTDWKVETRHSLDNIWYTCLDRQGVSDYVDAISIPLHINGEPSGTSSANYHAVNGIRITVNGATGASHTPGVIAISSVQLRDSRPSMTAAEGLGALDIRGGSMYGDVDWRYGTVKVAGSEVWHPGNFDPDTKSNTTHTHSIADVTSLQSTLDGKASASHTHVAGDIISGTFAIERIPTGTTSTTVAVGNHNHSGVYAPASHSHAAGDINSGVLAIARIPTGTTSSTVSLGNHNHSGVYAPVSHTHTIANVTGLQGALNDKADVVHTHATGDITSGRFSAARLPTSATANRVLKVGTANSNPTYGQVAWGELTGVPGTFPPAGHTHTIANVTGLQSALDGKANTSHTHAAGDVTSGTFNIARIPTGTTGSTVALGNHNHNSVYAAISHSHDISDVTNLQSSLNAKSDTSHNHTLDSLSNVTISSNANGEILRWNGTAWINNTLSEAGIAASSHTHSIANITNLQTELNGKANTAHNHATGDITSGRFVAARMPTSGTANRFLRVGAANSDPVYAQVSYGELTGVPSTFTPSSHSHAAGDVTSGTFAIARIPTGTTSSTVSLGNHSHTPASIGAAAASHTHSAGDINSGTLAVNRGGTGISSYTANNYIRASGSTTLQQRTPAQVRSDIGAAATSHTHALGDLSNVTLGTPSNGQVLTWNGSAWVNDTVSPGTFANGTAAAPSITFTNDTDTGIYRYAANAVGISAGGNRAAYFTYSGGNGWLNVDALQLNSSLSLRNNAPIYIRNSDDSASFPALYYGGDNRLGLGDAADAGTVLWSNTVALINSGTEADPVLTFDNDRDTGIYRPGENTLAITAGGGTVLELSDTEIEVEDSEYVGLLIDETGVRISSPSEISGLINGAERTLLHTGSPIESLSNVTITSNTNGEILRWNGSAWVNNTLAEAGIAAASHTHAASDINSGTFVDARIPNLNASKITAGTLSVARGGTGATTHTSGNFLRGNGTGAITSRTPAQVLSDIGAQPATFPVTTLTPASGSTTVISSAYLNRLTVFDTPNGGTTRYIHVPADSTYNAPIGSVIRLLFRGIQPVRIEAATGATLHISHPTNTGGLTTNQRTAVIYKVAANMWVGSIS